jgi:hypothetical protein
MRRPDHLEALATKHQRARWAREATPERFELPTYWFEASRSIQLSYGAERVPGELYRSAATVAVRTAYRALGDFGFCLDSPPSWILRQGGPRLSTAPIAADLSPVISTHQSRRHTARPPFRIAQRNDEASHGASREASRQDEKASPERHADVTIYTSG